MALNQVNAIILVGGPGQSALREVAGHPVSLLPVPGKKHFLYTWFETLMKVDAVTKVDVLTGKPEDLRSLSAATNNWDAAHLGQTGVYADKENHRGTAGALKDFMTSLQYEGDLLIVEGNCKPPTDPKLLFDIEYDRKDVIGSLGRTSTYDPSGMMVVKNRILELIPDIGFFDLKEQLIPRALDRGERIIVRDIGGESSRLSDGKSYLQCIKSLAERDQESGDALPTIHEDAQVHPSADIAGYTLVDANVRIEAEATIQNSAILDGAVIGHDTLIVDSVIGREQNVPAGTKIIRDTVYSKSAAWKNGALA